MKKRGIFRFMMGLFVFILVTVESQACTGIRIKTQDGNYIFGRTMEFDAHFMPHDIITVPRNFQYIGQTPSGKPGMTWKTTYSSVGFCPAGNTLMDDGLNEKGLSCSGFFFPGFAKYENVPESDYPGTVSNIELVSWILGTCASVAEVKGQLPKLHVVGVVMPTMGYVPPLHYFVADKTGDAAVIEYIDGKLYMYDNAANVITNAPDYPWQTTNLRNYIGLKPDNNEPIKINGNDFAPLGQGSGCAGLPGDFLPPSRFIRASFFANAASEGKDVEEGISNAFHILNQFDIPLGSIRGKEGNASVYDTTQWTAASDLTNARYFYHTYHDRSVRVIDLKKIDPDAKVIKRISDVQKTGIIKDVSDMLQ